MKKIFATLLTVVVVFMGMVLALATVDINRLGKDNLYVQISEHTDIEETRLDSGEVVKRYWYELPAYDENGVKNMVEFSAARELRLDAYLMLYVKNENEVTSYDEVQWNEIPTQAQEKLDN
ncbi:YxeA family protein [Bacillus horti]|uniref:Uncharacterized protein (TIGR01655 family) n=1 Tax=Caldalkalibacillus horti TaxID=77523 RepID=A0ABT9VXH0_9BACI|nr:YxeA family protein [Bacillus horti]MDQ0165315.1 uncharacterized protein (TIGR01655 family) [Bacillus horti]